MAKRIGDRMRQVVTFVERHPGCSKRSAAAFVGPHRSLQFGYRTVDRAITAGLIIADLRSNGRYRLTVPE